jgi:hypothetical protein
VPIKVNLPPTSGHGNVRYPVKSLNCRRTPPSSCSAAPAVGCDLDAAVRAQGLPVHRDSYPVFALQLAGTKHWTLYEPSEKNPGRSYLEVDLQPGARGRRMK